MRMVWASDNVAGGGDRAAPQEGMTMSKTLSALPMIGAMLLSTGALAATTPNKPATKPVTKPAAAAATSAATKPAAKPAAATTAKTAPVAKVAPTTKPAPVATVKPTPAPAPTAKPAVTPTVAAKPAPKPKAKPAAVADGRMVTTKTSTGKTITYNCSKAGNANKKACK
jgi:outer membrane biosynthesis protein TonB